MRFAFVVAATVFAQVVCSAAALAGGGKRITPEARKAACDEAAAHGFHETRPADWSKITRGGATQLELVMPVNFIAYNQTGGFFHMGFDEGEANRFLAQLRDVYRGCGIEVELHTLRYATGPDFLNNQFRNPDEESELSENERCLYRPLQIDGEVNVFFVPIVTSTKDIGRSHAWLAAYFTPSEPGDQRYVGAVAVTEYDRSSFSKTATFVVPHEVGHVVFDMGHVSEYNLMGDSAEKLSYYVNKEQCERARSSRFVRSRNSVGYDFPATGKIYRVGN